MPYPWEKKPAIGSKTTQNPSHSLNSRDDLKRISGQVAQPKDVSLSTKNKPTAAAHSTNTPSQNHTKQSERRFSYAKITIPSLLNQKDIDITRPHTHTGQKRHLELQIEHYSNEAHPTRRQSIHDVRASLESQRPRERRPTHPSEVLIPTEYPVFRAPTATVVPINFNCDDDPVNEDPRLIDERRVWGQSIKDGRKKARAERQERKKTAKKLAREQDREKILRRKSLEAETPSKYLGPTWDSKERTARTLKREFVD
ncbi:MAG: hypothetical protein MMC33_000704 [Icmadophila ericetorum]|nr:hypothetical protein [Icmadophila ericetorum]